MLAVELEALRAVLDTKGSTMKQEGEQSDSDSLISLQLKFNKELVKLHQQHERELTRLQESHEQQVTCTLPPRSYPP